MKKQIMASEEEEDRISGLSDDILCHILSFSDKTEEVVRASLVPKRWRYVWISVPTIIISDEYLKGVVYPPALKTRFVDFVDRVFRCNVKARFMDFVDRVLRCNVVSCLRKLRLHCFEFYYDDDEKSRISELMNAVIARSAEDFDFGFHVDQRVEFPSRYFTCNNNVMVLRLQGIVLDVPTPANLGNLKILILQVMLCNEVTLKNLLEGCPVLEELDLNCDYYSDVENLFVKSSSLKKLRINTLDVEDYELGILVDATNLERLELTCHVAEVYELSSLSSLLKVYLNLYTNTTSKSDLVEANDCGRKMDEILRKISNTQWMCLSEHTMKRIEHARLDNLPVFSNLTGMDLTMYEDDWQVLPYLLECSPNLSTLALTFTSEKYLKLPQYFRKPKCLMLYLQYINLENFRGSANGMQMVSYFLENAIVLKKMSISRYYSDSRHVEIIEKLLMFPRSSSACQIAIE